MNVRLLIRIAKALLLARWKQTLVAAIGVTFSITMFVTLLSFMTGLNDLLDNLILNRTPHVRLFNEIKPDKLQPVNSYEGLRGAANFISSIKSNNSHQEIYNADAILRRIKNDPRVLGVAPKLNAQVFFNDGAIDITGVINGIDVEAEMKLFFFNDYITSGSAMDLKEVSNSVVLGKGLADKLVANIGDVIQVTTSKGDRIPLKVVGFFQLGLLELDKTQCYASIRTVQKLIGKPNSYITDIQVKLKNIIEAPAVAGEYAKLFETDTEDIQTANAQFETGSRVRTIISYAVGITLLVVAGFGIYNILNMMIYEKMDSIAILKATGFSGWDVNRIFIFIAISIGIFGGLLGLFFGFMLSSAIDIIPFNTASLPTVKTYPINYNPMFYLIGFLFSFITTYFAGLFPAQKASKLDPVIIIRGK